MPLNEQETVNILVQLGDLLDATDQVKESNAIGFNKADKSSWPLVRGDLLAMKTILAKYRSQLKCRFDEALIESVDWQLPKEARSHFSQVKQKAKAARALAEKLKNQAVAKVTVTIEGKDGFGLILETDKRLERNRFQHFLTATRNAHGRCLVDRDYLWVVPFSIDFSEYAKKLAEVQIELSAIPELDPSLKKAAEQDVIVSMREDSTLAIKHPYSSRLNEAYKNQEETSGVIGFDWSTKERLVGSRDLNDLDEVLMAIRTHHPKWKIGYSFDIEAYRQNVTKSIKARRVITPEITSKLKKDIVPLPYQIEGYNWYKALNGRALNGDDMGLGKTFQTLLYAANHNLKTLVICPKNVRRNWLSECEKFFVAGTFNGYEIDSSKTQTDVDLSHFNIVTINYEILDKYLETLKSAGFELLVVDESHRIKNRKAQVTSQVLYLGQGIEKRICLSGTPLKNKKKELFTQSNLIHPGTFRNELEISQLTFFETKERIKTFFFRRTKKAELKDLPDKIRSVFEFVGKETLPDMRPGMEVGDIAKLKKDLAIAKSSATVEFVKDLLENTESKIIVFSDSDDAAEKIQSLLGDVSVLHTGATPHEKRERIKKEFMDENSLVRVFVATTGSAREGINLTIADRIIFNDLPWTPADLNQAEARAHRIGQKNCVNVYWMKAINNFDQHVINLLFKKMAIYEKVINGKKPSPEEEKFLAQPIVAALNEHGEQIALRQVTE